ncbi:MAG TPA: hypothetical protein VKQ11_17865 [Candidatus Sulfotelmatobacter sp.]|nr:hypothetical protein [Candidatus Sulfotelmatobacter sp.]
MDCRRNSRAWLVSTLLITLLFVTVAASSSRGREFSGYFDVSQVRPEGDLVQATLHLRLFNHSDADAKSVIVTLIDSSPSMTFRGNFHPVKVWKSHQFLEMSQEFTVTKREFHEWMAPPAQPNLVILFQDAKGTTWQRGAQISRRPLVPAQQ